MIITLAGLKGGSGKSTTALHLAGALAELGPVALLDLDTTNATCAEYAAAGHLPYPVATPDTWPELSRQTWAHVVIDAPGRPTHEQARYLASAADLNILPTTPDAVSLRVLARTLPAMRAAGAPYRVLLTQTPPWPSRDTDRARIDLRGAKVPHFDTTIPAAAAFRHAARHRRFAWDVPGVRGSHLRLAFEALAQEVLQ